MPDWWEQMVGSNASVANQNDDPDHDGWTLLEDYLEFMAHPYVIVGHGATGRMDVKPYFTGFYGQNANYDKVTPAYTVTAESSLFTTAINGSELNVVAGQNAGFGYVNVTVDDGETQWTQRFGVAVSSAATGVQTINHTPQYKDPTFYDLQGRRLSELKKGGVYIQNGKKIIVK
jgi:hypothetical protein